MIQKSLNIVSSDECLFLCRCSIQVASNLLSRKSGIRGTTTRTSISCVQWLCSASMYPIF